MSQPKINLTSEQADAFGAELDAIKERGEVVTKIAYADWTRSGMVVGLDSVGGDFTLPDTRPRRTLFVSGGSGITPVMSMLRTMRNEGSDREIAFIHYARGEQEEIGRAHV